MKHGERTHATEHWRNGTRTCHQLNQGLAPYFWASFQIVGDAEGRLSSNHSRTIFVLAQGEECDKTGGYISQYINASTPAGGIYPTKILGGVKATSCNL